MLTTGSPLSFGKGERIEERGFCPSRHAMIAVTFALRAESSEFLRRLRAKTELERNGLKVVRGNAGHRMVEVLHTGVGEKVCVERVGKFLHDQQFDVLISTGFAGALNDELQL